MSNLEAVKELYARPKTYKIPAKPKKGQTQVELSVKPLALDEMASLDNLDENATPSEVVKNAKKMLSMSLEGVSEDEAGQISFEYMVDILDAIVDVNNFKEEDLKKTGIKNFIEMKKKQAEEQKAKVDGAGKPTTVP